MSATPQNGLRKDSGADAFQVKSVSHDRLVRRLGALAPAEMAEIAAAIALCVGYR
ncbi:MAG: type II toxin-antitoxin system PemK/MazF family toxin [Ktedonobacterales bacterium]|nr:type II toxin-antitoxin system PemK/MazF family toxin [Ktedonobacterales bacterium]